MSRLRFAGLVAVSMLLVDCRYGYDADLSNDGGVDAAYAGTTVQAGTQGHGSAGASGSSGGALGTSGASALGGTTSSASGSGGAQPVAGTAGIAGIGAGGIGAGGIGAGGTTGAPCRSATYATHDYLFCDVGADFSTARADCRARGMYLARIDDSGEQTWVHSQIPAADQVSNNSSVWRWLGGNDLAADEDWRWGDGAAFWSGGHRGTAINGAYTNWSNSDPSTGTNSNDCVAMEARLGLWYDMDCTAARPYVCERY